MKNIQEVVPANKLGRTRSNSHPTSQMAGPTAHRRRTSRLASISLSSLAPPTVAALRQQTGLPDVNTGTFEYRDHSDYPRGLTLITDPPETFSHPQSRALHRSFRLPLDRPVVQLEGYRPSDWLSGSDKALAFVGDSAEKMVGRTLGYSGCVERGGEALRQRYTARPWTTTTSPLTSTETLKTAPCPADWLWSSAYAASGTDKLQHLVDGLRLGRYTVRSLCFRQIQSEPTLVERIAKR